MRYLTVPALTLLVLSINAACSDDGGGGGGGDGGADGSSGGDGSGALVGTNGGETTGVGGGAASGACDTEAETLVADVGAFTLGIAVSDTTVAYVTRVDLSSPTGLSVVGLDGTGQEEIYASAEGMAIESLTFSGEDVLFLEAADGETADTLFSIPTTGGDPVQISTDTFEKARLLGADASAAYLYVDAPTAAILRVDLAAGTSETVGTIPGAGGVLHPSIAGDDLYFVAGTGLQTVFQLAITDTDAEPAELFQASGTSGCGFPLGGLVATPTRLVCGYLDVAAFTRDDGTSQGLIIDGDATSAAAHVVVASAEESVYMIQLNDGTFDAKLSRVSSDGSDETALVCDLGKVSTQTADGFFPISNHYQIAVAGDRIVWVEERLPEDADTATVSIRSAPL